MQSKRAGWVLDLPGSDALSLFSEKCRGGLEGPAVGQGPLASVAFLMRESFSLQSELTVLCCCYVGSG
jgi:hypothetical protein